MQTQAVSQPQAVSQAEREFEFKARLVIEGIQRFNFSEFEIRVLLLAREHSFLQGRDTAVFTKLCEIASLTGIPENKVRRPIDSLVRSGALKVFDEAGELLRGKTIARRAYRYGVMTDYRFWDMLSLKCALTPERQRLKAWLLSLNPWDAEPRQPALPELAPTLSLGESLQTIAPTPVASPGADRDDRLKRSKLVRDAGPGETGGEQQHRESAGSVPRHQAMPAAGLTAPPLRASEQQCEELTSAERSPAFDWDALKRSIASGAGEEPPKMGGSNLPKWEEKDPNLGGKSSQNGRLEGEGGETSQNGRLQKDQCPLGQNGDPPKMGGLSINALSALSVSMPCKGIKAPKALMPKAANAGRWAQEDAFMAQLEEWLGKECGGYGGRWRLQWRAHREIVEECLNDLIVRLDNQKPVGSRGAWMWTKYVIRLRANGLKIARAQAS